MSALPAPGPLFNPVIDSSPLSPGEILAGPFGLLAFLPLIPLVLLVARRYRRSAIVTFGLVWLLVTLRLPAAAVLLGGLAAGLGWVVLLGTFRRRDRLGERAMIALVWAGLHALALPLWWHAQQSWYPSRMAAFHNIGLAYFLLRFIAWGTAWAKNPQSPLRLADSLCWLLYPPCMRLGPLLLRGEFLRRLEAWDPRRSPAWVGGLKRFGLFLLGGVGLALVLPNVPIVPRGSADFFADPAAYSTGQLFRVFYLIPIQIYLLLWTYNELAATLGLWLGIPVPNNFDWLPRATSVRDFWRRWHITLGAWLRNYIYIPLGGNRGAVPLHYVAAFGYCGVWHGASWSFLAWAGTQALALTVQRGWDRLRSSFTRRDHPARADASALAPASPPQAATQARLAPVSRDFVRRLTGLLWIVVCWALTVHYQIATILVFVDFEHSGGRLLRELFRRLAA